MALQPGADLRECRTKLKGSEPFNRIEDVVR